MRGDTSDITNAIHGLTEKYIYAVKVVKGFHSSVTCTLSDLPPSRRGVVTRQFEFEINRGAAAAVERTAQEPKNKPYLFNCKSPFLIPLLRDLRRSVPRTSTTTPAARSGHSLSSQCLSHLTLNLGEFGCRRERGED